MPISNLKFLNLKFRKISIPVRPAPRIQRINSQLKLETAPLNLRQERTAKGKSAPWCNVVREGAPG
jgi:hypothetical protein